MAAPCPCSAGEQVGITLNLSPTYPETSSPDDQAAATRADGFFNRWFLDPLYGRGYPEDLAATFGDIMPEMQGNDLDLIATPTDFLGINYYFPQTLHAVSPDENPLGAANRTPEQERAAGRETTEMGWPVVADGLYELLTRVHRDYAPKAIYITENGAAFSDEVQNGQVDDPRRIAYLHDHFLTANRALGEGVPLRGYFVWSLMDNFEWAHGYAKRFGIVYVDYETQDRIPKTSANWYKRVIAENTVLPVE
jgi:beta-glucosidase